MNSFYHSVNLLTSAKWVDIIKYNGILLIILKNTWRIYNGYNYKARIRKRFQRSKRND